MLSHSFDMSVVWAYFLDIIFADVIKGVRTRHWGLDANFKN